MGLSLGLVCSFLTQQPAVSHTASCLSPGGQLSARTAEMGSPAGLSLSREDSPSPLLLFPWEVTFCFICLSFQVAQCFQKAIHLKLKILYTENNGS